MPLRWRRRVVHGTVRWYTDDDPHLFLEEEGPTGCAVWYSSPDEWVVVARRPTVEAAKVAAEERRRGR